MEPSASRSTRARTDRPLHHLPKTPAAASASIPPYLACTSRAGLRRSAAQFPEAADRPLATLSGVLPAARPARGEARAGVGAELMARPSTRPAAARPASAREAPALHGRRGVLLLSRLLLSEEARRERADSRGPAEGCLPHSQAGEVFTRQI